MPQQRLTAFSSCSASHHGSFWCSPRAWLAACALVLLSAGSPVLAQQQDTGADNRRSNQDSDTIQLKQSRSDDSRFESERRGRTPAQPTPSRVGQTGSELMKTLGEFERYVKRLLERQGETFLDKKLIRRLGTDVMAQHDRNTTGIDAYSAPAPDDYIVGIGDEILVALWGSVEGELRLVVDKGGRVLIPKVGPVLVAGKRLSDLNAAISQRVARVFKNFQVSASLGRVRTIRVYVTGFVQEPGTHNVSSLTTVVGALAAAGGPSAGGSFRQIELRRQGRLLRSIDLYDLLLKGDSLPDLVLQAEDVIHVLPVGIEVAVLGHVNKPAIVELKPNEGVEDALMMAGGLAPLAARQSVTIQGIDSGESGSVREVRLNSQSGKHAVRSGDVIFARSTAELAQPKDRQTKRVRVEGEVGRPGDFVLPAHSTINDALKAAGGLTQAAFVFGTELTRESTRAQQQANYERALRDLETELTRASSTLKATSADEASAQAARATSSSRLVEQLRSVRPTGRIVLQLAPDERQLPDLELEDGDRLVVPSKPSTVGVFGSVFNAGSYLHKPGASVEDSLQLAGGPTRGADTASTFVIRANGSVVSARQRSSGWLSIGSSLSSLSAQPGDTIFVPEELNKTTFVQEAKEWTQILYQFGLGAAALKTIKN